MRSIAVTGWFGRFASLLLALGVSGCIKTPDRYAAVLYPDADPPANFELHGEPFCFAGANTYYLINKPHAMVDDVLTSAQALHFPVLRIWAFLDIGSLDGSRKPVDPHSDAEGRKDDVYFQYWDGAQNRPVINDGPNGVQRLDYALAKAAETGVKLMLVLTNNWYDYGGMDQYLTWYGRSKHYEFYTAPEVRQAYKNYVSFLVNRKNSVNGRLYRDDPTIFGWELGNEPRCKGTGAASAGWTNTTMVTWADEMSRYIKSIDPNHLVSVGDEGFLDGGGEHWAYKANDGVDHRALTAVPGIDFGTYHSYPTDWGTKLEWGDQWIIAHEQVARELHKPTLLEEYGVKVERDEAGRIRNGLSERLDTYARWNNLALRRGGNASLVWMLGGRDTLYPDPRGLYHDYDGYTAYRGDDTAQLLSQIAERYAREAPACKLGYRSDTPSDFVRVQRPRSSRQVAYGWGPTDG